ncbi:HD-GYP domain-containing protein [Rubinisphaera margarita]|uniref:HD-GYP domain-containing protein n=1 Tax=Rubinisphaera margarita TaxID=2909586 RepID=UPI001EE80297|nr:HD-GYP domain-containing protein [Rubinisphaera margarita]MCG6155841.1 HD-GYP domain-containing protein [Rubinisphaera margarita]
MSQITTDNTTDHNQLHQIAERLSDRFDCGIEIWRKMNDWMPVVRGDDRLSPSSVLDVHFYISTSKLTNDPALRQINPEQSLFILPVDSRSGFQTVAVGICSHSSEALLQNALQQESVIEELHAREKSQAEQVDLYAAQVTADFEEMTWLRNLAQQLGSCTVERSLESLASATLEMLADLIRCKTVALITPRQNQRDDEDEFDVLLWGQSFPRKSCCDLMLLVREDAFKQPVVWNRDRVRAAGDKVPSGVNSFIVTPLRKDGTTYGWLTAINKKKDLNGQIRSHLHDDLEGISELEFGTSEATLVSSTASLLASHAKNLELFQQQQNLLIGVIRTMMNSLDAKDPYTCGHSDRVAQYARIIAENLGLPADECENIYVTGLVHDIGKVGVPDHILKKPGRLTDEEFDEIKKHPRIGFVILQHLSAFSFVLPGVLHHHESMDGTGYPDQLKGEDIPLHARILAVADAYDAMTSTRPYRDGMPVRKAVSILLEGRHTQWDAACVDAFLDSMPTVLEITIEANRQKEKILRNSTAWHEILQQEITNVQEAVAAVTFV